MGWSRWAAGSRSKFRRLSWPERWLLVQAITLLPTYLSSPEGANLPATQKTDLTSQLHYTLGLTYLRQKRMGSSQTEFLTIASSL